RGRRTRSDGCRAHRALPASATAAGRARPLLRARAKTAQGEQCARCGPRYRRTRRVLLRLRAGPYRGLDEVAPPKQEAERNERRERDPAGERNDVQALAEPLERPIAERAAGERRCRTYLVLVEHATSSDGSQLARRVRTRNLRAVAGIG